MQKPVFNDDGKDVTIKVEQQKEKVVTHARSTNGDTVEKAPEQT